MIDSDLRDDASNKRGSSGNLPPNLRQSQAELKSFLVFAAGADCACNHMKGAEMSKSRARNTADPRPCKSFPVAGAVRRRVWCLQYGECLDVAVENKWDSFMCTSCEAFQPQMLTPDQLQLDADCCLALLYALSRRRATGKHLHGLLEYLESERRERQEQEYLRGFAGRH